MSKFLVFVTDQRMGISDVSNKNILSCSFFANTLFCFATFKYRSKSHLYKIEDSLMPDLLTVHVNRHAYPATKLVLSASFIKEQVQNLSCDGKALKKDSPGVWSVPAGCKKIQWQVLLSEGTLTLASEQQSIKTEISFFFQKLPHFRV